MDEKDHSEDGHVILRNPHIKEMEQDFLYHISLSSGSQDLVEMFSDVKFVCMGGTPRRMEKFAQFVQKELDIKLPTGAALCDISARSYRYSMYKIGPVISVSVGLFSDINF
ncbi:uridine phosphorylase 1 [Trichonephila clavata]|uniref:Uridine phosphorylase 1 n=1 Tax=Trichonephila clavata TaxID=2740835 RepID=A0A8X6F1X2_TRICU|nr:uridine phosphorylase 1 [Trichonephila clavata]